MKKSVNFKAMNNNSKSCKEARSIRGFVNLAKWVGMSDEKVVESVKEISKKSEEPKC